MIVNPLFLSGPRPLSQAYVSTIVGARPIDSNAPHLPLTLVLVTSRTDERQFLLMHAARERLEQVWTDISLVDDSIWW